MLKGVPFLVGDVNCDKKEPVCNLKDGDVFPDTYQIARGTSRLAVLDLAHKQMISVKDSLQTDI